MRMRNLSCLFSEPPQTSKGQAPNSTYCGLAISLAFAPDEVQLSMLVPWAAARIQWGATGSSTCCAWSFVGYFV